MSRNYGVPPRFRHGPSAVPDMDFRAHEDWGNREDDLDPPRGFMFVLALSGAFWAGTAFGVVMWQVFA